MDGSTAGRFAAEIVEVDPRSAWDFALALRAGVIVDVRFPEEREWFAQVPGALALPLSRLQHLAGFAADPPDDTGHADATDQRALLSLLIGHAHDGKTLLCLCAHGNRSLAAARLLRELGFANAFSIAGGIQAWEEAGLPLLQPDAD